MFIYNAREIFVESKYDLLVANYNIFQKNICSCMFRLISPGVSQLGFFKKTHTHKNYKYLTTS